MANATTMENNGPLDMDEITPRDIIPKLTMTTTKDQVRCLSNPRQIGATAAKNIPKAIY